MQSNSSYDNQYNPGFSGKKYLDAANRHVIQHGSAKIALG